MNDNNDMDFLEMGRLLALALASGGAAFEHRRQMLGLGLRRARYFVRVWNAFGSLDVDREMLLAVGWTKLQLVAHVVNSRNVGAWLVFLLNHSYQEARRVVDGKLPLEKLHALMFYLLPAEYEIVAAGLVKFGAIHEKGALIDKERALVAAMAHLRGGG